MYTTCHDITQLCTRHANMTFHDCNHFQKSIDDKFDDCNHFQKSIDDKFYNYNHFYKSIDDKFYNCGYKKSQSIGNKMFVYRKSQSMINFMIAITFFNDNEKI